MAKGKRDNDDIDIGLIKALAHPVRLKILTALDGRDASPNELQDILGLPLGNLAYHARVLERAGCVRQVRTARRRGAVEHFFRTAPRAYIGHPEWRKVPLSVRGAFGEAAIQTFVDRLAAALENGTFNQDDLTSLSWVTVSLDTVGRLKVAGILREALDKVEAVNEESERRMAHSGEQPTSVVVGVAAFEAAAPAQPGEEGEQAA